MSVEEVGVTQKRYFAVGARPTRVNSALVERLSKSILWLMGRRADDGTWGGPDSLDRLICTTHVQMTLMAAGLQPTSHLIQPSMNYLSELDVNKHTTFFWRSGPLLNVPGYEAVVNSDIDYLEQYKERAGGNPNYPAPFFLLKLLRFRDSKEEPARVARHIEWLLAEWSDKECWYRDTAITSMGVALLADIDATPSYIVEGSVQFLLDAFKSRESGRRGFCDNIVADAFTVYNIYERFDVLRPILGERIFSALDDCIHDIIETGIDGVWESSPPFGGAVESPDYATAVVIRAALAREYSTCETFESDLALAIFDSSFQQESSQPEPVHGCNPFWGELALSREAFCFIAMPFETRRTEIYENYVKAPIENHLRLKCRRADDITRSRQIMEDVWKLLVSCSMVIVDLSEQNANVFYELGMAHVLGKPVILIAEKLEDIPFDLRSIRTIIYGDSPNTWRKLADDIVEYVSSELNE